MNTVRYLLQNSKLSYVRVTCVMLLVKGLFKEVTQKSVDTFVREFLMQLRKNSRDQLNPCNGCMFTLIVFTIIIICMQQ